MNLKRKKIINFCTDQALQVVSIRDICILNGKRQELIIFSELSSKFTKSCDTSNCSNGRKNKSKSDLFVHLRTAVHYQSSVHRHSSAFQRKSNVCKTFGRSNKRTC